MALYLLCPFTGRCAGTIDYDGVLRRAINNSHEVATSRLDIAISDASLRYAKSLYYPVIKAK